MFKRPETIKIEHVSSLLDVYLPEMFSAAPQHEKNLPNRLKYIIKLMKESKLRVNVRNTLFNSLLEKKFTLLLSDPQKVEDFFNAGGASFIQTLINNINDIEGADLTALTELITLLIQHVPQIKNAAIKASTLDIIGLILNFENEYDLEITPPHIKVNLPNSLWNEVAQLEVESLLELFEKRNILLDIIPLPNKPSLAVRDLSLYDMLMRVDAIPNNWYSSLIEQSVAGANMFGQWVDEYWSGLSLAEQKEIHAYALSRWQQLGLPMIMRMDIKDSSELLGERYEFLTNNYHQLISGQNINAAVGFEALLAVIEQLTDFKGTISHQLIDLVDGARSIIPHSDLSSKAKGLKSKWGKAIKRSES